MTFNMAKQLILRECEIKTSEEDFNEMLLTLLYANKKADEKELIFQRIGELQKKGDNRCQAVCVIQYEFAKSKRQAYRIIEESGVYDG